MQCLTSGLLLLMFVQSKINYIHVNIKNSIIFRCLYLVAFLLLKFFFNRRWCYFAQVTLMVYFQHEFTCFYTLTIIFSGELRTFLLVLTIIRGKINNYICFLWILLVTILNLFFPNTRVNNPMIRNNTWLKKSKFILEIHICAIIYNWKKIDKGQRVDHFMVCNVLKTYLYNPECSKNFSTTEQNW